MGENMKKEEFKEESKEVNKAESVQLPKEDCEWYNQRLTLISMKKVEVEALENIVRARIRHDAHTRNLDPEYIWGYEDGSLKRWPKVDKQGRIIPATVQDIKSVNKK